MTQSGGDRERRGCLCFPLTGMWRVALLCPGANQTHRVPVSRVSQPGVRAQRCCYLSRWEVLEVAEGQVGDQVSSVPYEWLMTSCDAGRGENFAVPWAKCLPLVQSHVPQVSVNGFPPRKKINCSDLYDILELFLYCRFTEYWQNIIYVTFKGDVFMRFKHSGRSGRKRTITTVSKVQRNSSK